MLDLNAYTQQDAPLPGQGSRIGETKSIRNDSYLPSMPEFVKHILLRILEPGPNARFSRWRSLLLDRLSNSNKDGQQ